MASAARCDDARAVPTTQGRERVSCYLCGADEGRLVCRANDDLTGHPGTFEFVECATCRLVYQNPRIPLHQIGAFYSDEYIAHRKKTDWGPLTPLYEWAMGKHDRDKAALVRRHAACSSDTRLLDVGCGAGSFLAMMRRKHGCQVSGVDFVDLSQHDNFSGATFYHGVLCDQALPQAEFDVITMWHFLEHDYSPIATLQAARRALKSGGRLIIEVPRLDSASRWLFGNRWPGWQAPQHTAAYSKQALLRAVDKAGLEVINYLPYGAFPAYFYLFAGSAFKLLRGRGLDLAKAIYPYFAGQLLLAPLLMFERRLNLAMQTVVCGPRR